MSDPQHQYIVTIHGQDYDVSSPTPLTDVQAYQLAKPQSDTDQTLDAAPGASGGHSPETYWGGFTKGAKEGIVGGAKGFVKGVGDVVRHPVNTVVDQIKGAVGAVADTAQGAVNLYQDPAGTLQTTATSLKGLPQNAIKMLGDAGDKAATDPEGFGRDVGQMTANTEAGVALAGGLRFAPKPIARGVGSLAKTIGQQAKWPLRMVGAHQLGSGNPMGVVTMAIPEQLKKGGEGLQRWGTEAGAAAESPEGVFLQIQQDLRAGTTSPEALQAQADDLQQKLITRRKTAKLPEDITTAQKEQTRLDGLVKQIKQAAKTTPSEISGLSDEELLQKQYPTIKLDTSTNVPRPPAYQAPRTGAPVTPQAGVGDPRDIGGGPVSLAQTATVRGVRPAPNTLATPNSPIERVQAVNQDQGMVDKTGLEPRSKPSGGYEREIAARIAAENAARRVGPSTAERAAAMRAENPQIDAQAAAAQAASGAPVARTPIPDQVERGGFKLSPTASPPSATDAMTQQFEQRMAGKAAAEGASGPAAREKLIQQYVAKGVPRDQLEKVLDARSKSNITGAHTDPTLVLTPDQLAERKIKLQQSLVSEQEQGHLNAGRVSLAQFEDEIKDLPVDEQLARRAERLRNLRGGR